MAPSTLRKTDTDALQLIVEKECLEPAQDLPCAAVSLVGDGRRYATDLWHYVKCPSPSEENQDTRSDNDVYWLASCTKLVTAIACLQLVEKNILGLDDAECVSRLCPELEDVNVLGPNGQKTKRITLRMLLTHTGMCTQRSHFWQRLVLTSSFIAGFGYSFLNSALKAYRQLNLTDFDEFPGKIDDFK
jgi:CubicO group peptidase (beta-lactamase class C family)